MLHTNNIKYNAVDKILANKSIHGLELFHEIGCTKTPQEQQAFAMVITETFEKPVAEAEKNNLAGHLGDEAYVKTLSSSATNKASFYRMYMHGDQHAHCHAYGERQVTLYSAEPWFFYAGGSKTPEELDKAGTERKWIKINMPPGEIHLKMSPGFYHKFVANHMGAISFHTNDQDEIRSLTEDELNRQQLILQEERTNQQEMVVENLNTTSANSTNISLIEAAQDPALMERLTAMARQDAKIENGNVIGNGFVSFDDAQLLIQNSKPKSMSIAS